MIDDLLSRLDKMFAYDPQTGIVTRRIARGNRAKGSIVGSVSTHGHLNVSIDGGMTGVHRVAWALYYGHWPDRDIDHKNGVPSDNRICNLRLATVSENLANSKMYASNTSGFRGVRVQGRQIIARVRVRGKLLYLGQFNSKEAAHEAYQKAAKYHFGEFARGH